MSIQRQLTVWVCLSLCLSPGVGARAVEPAAMAPVKLAPKPAHMEPDRRARPQPTVPKHYREMPFVETAPEPELTAAEQQRGYMLFQRPITQPVYASTRPRPHERLERLVAFATPGEWEPVTLSVYPQRDLKNFRVHVSTLRGPGGPIDGSHVAVRLATYWNVGYPRYTSRDTYRRLPELLERVTVHSSPAGQCQRWWIQIHVPDRAMPGLYRAVVTVWDDGFDRAVEIPLALRVLELKLKADPAKHYSAYYYVRNRVQLAGKEESQIQKATGNEYRAMVEYGLDMLPTVYLGTDDRGERIVVRYAEELDRMLAVGLKGPFPVTGDSVIGRIYQDTTPGGKRANHWRVSKMPPPEFYRKVTTMFRAFLADCRAKGWPEVICCPMDEVAASHQELGWRVYQAVKAAGIRTYATKDPRSTDAAPYRPFVDVWCSQPYSTPYEEIVAQDRYEYWCYPNHNAGEIKDRRVMCKGGRMTYGFGFWRSGYTTLIPWNWAWTPPPDPFDYLRGSRSGCGQRMGDDGEVIPALYWDCFREGRDDARYIYTLQQAVLERQNSRDAGCRRLVEVGQAMLQETWDAIEVQPKYLADGMWPPEEFDARRWRMGKMIEALLKYPAIHKEVAPSVLVSPTQPKTGSAEPSPIQRALQQGVVQTKDLGGDLSPWHNQTQEGRTEVTATAGRGRLRAGLRWHVKVNHQQDGENSGGKYAVGWPRVQRSFRDRPLDLTEYDYLEFMLRVNSNRDEVGDDTTPLGLSIGSSATPNRLFTTHHDLGNPSHHWVPVRFSVKKMMETAGVGADPWKSVSYVQLFIAEGDYPHGAELTLDVGWVKLLRFTTPMISRLKCPRFVMLPRSALPITFEVVGSNSAGQGSYQVKACLVDEGGKVRGESRQDLTAGRQFALDASGLTPGPYTLRAQVVTARGQRLARIR